MRGICSEPMKDTVGENGYQSLSQKCENCPGKLYNLSCLLTRALMYFDYTKIKALTFLIC